MGGLCCACSPEEVHPVDATVEHPEAENPPAEQQGADHSPLRERLNKDLKIQTFRNPVAGLPGTPIGENARLYKFFCPLCQMYFQTAWKTMCCKNQICDECARNWIAQKLLKEEEIPQHAPLQIPCLYCNHDGFQLTFCSSSDQARIYSTSPATQRRLEHAGKTPEKRHTSSASISLTQGTPVSGVALSSIPSSSPVETGTPIAESSNNVLRTPLTEEQLARARAVVSDSLSPAPDFSDAPSVPAPDPSVSIHGNGMVVVPSSSIPPGPGGDAAVVVPAGPGPLSLSPARRHSDSIRHSASEQSLPVGDAPTTPPARRSPAAALVGSRVAPAPAGAAAAGASSPPGPRPPSAPAKMSPPRHSAPAAVPVSSSSSSSCSASSSESSAAAAPSEPIAESKIVQVSPLPPAPPPSVVVAMLQAPSLSSSTESSSSSSSSEPAPAAAPAAEVSAPAVAPPAAAVAAGPASSVSSVVASPAAASSSAAADSSAAPSAVVAPAPAA